VHGGINCVRLGKTWIQTGGILLSGGAITLNDLVFHKCPVAVWIDFVNGMC